MLDGINVCINGHVSVGESSEDTVKREVYEECSIRVDHVQYYADHHWSASSTLLIGCFAQALNTDIKVTTPGGRVWLYRLARAGSVL